VLDRVGEDQILFASDYPHWDGNFPYMVSTLQNRRDISDDAKRKIMYLNALTLYGWNR
jgi:predicted TIM-barrel fold metal-dependent hydrolase